MIYYNAIVKTDYQTSIKYHDITKLDKFFEYISSNVSVKVIFVYKKLRRKDSKGQFYGIWTKKKGLKIF